ncbi:MAG TPA: UDP-3-O-(3-hydroxymyristoyl)glucosamine N-acyltransferase [Ignavibacteria bacterium]|nr:UDP-3-O-(3-hydroxymyristoyl)glucosamine N-acyltransferase [Ignavibacteria bacterium]
MTTGEIAELLNGKITGNANLEINSIGKIENAKPDQITFISNPLYEKYYGSTNAGAVLVSKDFKINNIRKEVTLIRVSDPYLSFLELIEKFDNENEEIETGISAQTSIADNVRLGDDIFIDDFVKIGKNSIIGENSKIYSNVTIDKNVLIGKNCIIYPNTVIFKNSNIGDNVIIHSGAVIGGDGFGQAKGEDGKYIKIPQKGSVKIDDDVEIGSNTNIDRATIGETIISRGVKIDNQVQIAHNVEIGEDTVIAAQTGIAGSTKIGKNCMIGGKVGIVGHIKICDNVIIGAATNISKSIDTPGIYTGYRGKPHRDDLKIEANLKKFLESN